MEGCWEGRGQKLEDKLGLSREGLTTTRLLFFFPWQTHPGTWPSLSPFFHPPTWLGRGLLPPGNLRFQKGRDGEEGVEPWQREGTETGSSEPFPRRPLAPPAPGWAVEVKVPSEPLSAPVGKTAELACSYSTSVGDNFALEWSFVQPGRPVSASQPVSWGHLLEWGAFLPLVDLTRRGRTRGPSYNEGRGQRECSWG